MTIKKLYTPAEVLEVRSKLFSLTVDDLLTKGYINMQAVLGDRSTFSVVLTDAGEKKIACIKEVRDLTHLGLAESKGLIDSTPSLILTGLDQRAANRAAEVLRGIGATVQVKREATS